MTSRKKMTVAYFDQLLNATPGKLLEVIGTQPDDAALDGAELTLVVVNLLGRLHGQAVTTDKLTDSCAKLAGKVAHLENKVYDLTHSDEALEASLGGGDE